MKSKLTNYLALLLVLIAQLGFAQERSVTGVVTDNNGLPLPGVSILVKGTSTGTQTDFYPVNEQTVNTTNYKAAVEAIGGVDRLKVHVFWDKF